MADEAYTIEIVFTGVSLDQARSAMEQALVEVQKERKKLKFTLSPWRGNILPWEFQETQSLIFTIKASGESHTEATSDGVRIVVAYLKFDDVIKHFWRGAVVSTRRAYVALLGEPRSMVATPSVSLE
jgi:hypothetical protein